MSSSYSVTVPMTARIKVPKPLDSEGRPVPGVYEVKATVGGSVDPAERKARLREEFQKRLEAFQSWLTSHGDRNVARQLWAIKAFIEFILEPEKFADSVKAVASPTLPAEVSVTQSRTATPEVPTQPETRSVPDPGPTWSWAFVRPSTPAGR